MLSPSLLGRGRNLPRLYIYPHRSLVAIPPIKFFGAEVAALGGKEEETQTGSGGGG